MKLILVDTSPFCGAIDAPVLDFWWRLRWVSNLGLIFACVLSRLYDPQIHLWCDTCWLYGGRSENFQIWCVPYFQSDFRIKKLHLNLVMLGHSCWEAENECTVVCKLRKPPVWNYRRCHGNTRGRAITFDDVLSWTDKRQLLYLYHAVFTCLDCTCEPWWTEARIPASRVCLLGSVHTERFRVRDWSRYG